MSKAQAETNQKDDTEENVVDAVELQ